MTIETPGNAEEDLDDERLRRRYGHYAPLYSFIDARVRKLQSGYLRKDSGDVASLAKLRRVAGADPGSEPAVWEVMKGMPASLIGSGDAPSKSETAAHHALTLYALHQQSKGGAMHRRGRGIGLAARRLGRERAVSEEATRRRFQALGTASSLAEAVHHARGLISQFRAADVPLDYAAFAVDLARWQDPLLIKAVRLAWGRDYYRAFAIDDETDSAASGIDDDSSDDKSLGEEQ
ncbi:type I-E CRISPR-associated protein Cse2/CasB [Compostimonas suwonensis]|uniref:CRISPR system Cascade subunit CasB n=1 Tax=Compostimonas suwonensis TaxID=1048394 RepID=A0A2M9C3S5_9MICO|nr:type I-E CRISPR-associated protein Cse2/CasB [Compostimonas suwonensis]PJJ65183.1 CRISPR system Cascade subunit CasB [Compostimonas suwonensis]